MVRNRSTPLLGVLVCIRAGSHDLYEGLISVSQQLVSNTFDVFIAQTTYKLLLPDLLLYVSHVH